MHKSLEKNRLFLVFSVKLSKTIVSEFYIIGGDKMNLYEIWMEEAYTADGQSDKKFWSGYLPKEQAIYEYILEHQKDTWHTSVNEIAQTFNLNPFQAVGFLDGISNGLKSEIDVEALEEDSKLTIEIDFKNLFLTMVEYRADHLINLDAWDNIFSKEERNQMYKEKRNEHTVVNTENIGRNDPCPCGSGKKYKHCCMKK